MNRRNFITTAVPLVFATPSLLAQDKDKFTVLGYTFGDNIAKYDLKKTGYSNNLASWVSESMADVSRVVDFYKIDKDFPPFTRQVSDFKRSYTSNAVIVGKMSHNIIGLALYQSVEVNMESSDPSNYVAKEYESIANSLAEKYSFSREDKKTEYANYGNFFLWSKIYEKGECTIRISRIFSDEGLNSKTAQLKLTYVDNELYKKERELVYPKRDGF